MFSRLFRQRPALPIHCNKSSLAFATVDPNHLSHEHPHTVLNFVKGEWVRSKETLGLLDPVHGEVGQGKERRRLSPFLYVSDTKEDEIDVFVQSLNSCPKHGLHNPLKNPERYVMLGNVTAKIAARMKEPDVVEFFARLVQRVAPKSWAQAVGEINVTQKFLENFGGDQVRFLARGFSVPGDHPGQTSHGLRWPYGPCAIISPFNFPIEIPVLQLFGALFMGNKVLHTD